MSGFIGSLLLVAGFLMIAYAFSAARRRDPPNWLVDGFAGELISLLSVAALSFGFAYALYFFATLDRQPLVVPQAAALLATPLACWVLWRFLRRSVSDESAMPSARVVALPVLKRDDPRQPDEHFPRAA